MNQMNFVLPSCFLVLMMQHRPVEIFNVSINLCSNILMMGHICRHIDIQTCFSIEEIRVMYKVQLFTIYLLKQRHATQTQFHSNYIFRLLLENIAMHIRIEEERKINEPFFPIFILVLNKCHKLLSSNIFKLCKYFLLSFFNFGT